MRSARGMVVAVVVLAAVGGVCFAELSAGQKMAAEALIKQLSGEQFKLREQAVERLAAIGPDVIPLIKPLLESDDEEIKLRAEMVLKRIREQHPDAAGLPETAGAFDREHGSLITLKLTNADVQTVLARIAQQSGNPVLGLPEDWQGKPMTVDWDRVPYWKAMDEVCRTQGLVYEADRRGRSLRLVEVPEIREITSYAGPVVFKITHATKNRSYRSSRNVSRLTYNVSAFWEDRLKPSWNEPAEVERITDQNGAEIDVPEDTAARTRRARRPRFWRAGAGANMPVSGFTVSVPNYPEGLAQLKEVSGTQTLAFAKGTQEITIEDVLAAGEKSGQALGYELKVTESNRRRRFMSLKAVLTKDGKPAEWPNYGGGQRYGVWLVDMADKRYRGYVSPGQVEVRNVGAGRAQARVQVVIGGDEGEGGAVRMMFQRVPEEMDVLRLVVVFPAEVETKTYPFKFTEVPVP